MDVSPTQASRMDVSIDARLAQLGIDLPHVAAPAGAYAPAVRSGQYIYTSGQLPLVNGALPVVGHVGHVGSSEGSEASEAGEGLVTWQQAAQLARLCALNALAAVKSVHGSLDGLAIVKVVGFVASRPDFTQQADVLNGASHVIHDIFGHRGVHARSAVGVAVLPLNSPIEVELIAQVLGL